MCKTLHSIYNMHTAHGTLCTARHGTRHKHGNTERTHLLLQVTIISLPLRQLASAALCLRSILEKGRIPPPLLSYLFCSRNFSMNPLAALLASSSSAK